MLRAIRRIASAPVVASSTNPASSAGAGALADAILPHLPRARFAFAYGSAAFKQHGHLYTKNTMLDVIVAVDDAEAFHRENMRRNPSHYPALARVLGPRTIASIQIRTGAAIYYHPFVKLGGQLAKYGVISMQDMLRDLNTWETLYVSGRLHKPVVILTPTSSNDELHDALQRNLRSAVLAACCLLPNKFEEFELYHTIASLSYTGDVRMAVAERKGKAYSIVKGNFDSFRGLYASTLRDLGCSRAGDNEEQLSNPLSSLTTEQVIAQLPLHLQQRLNARKPLEGQVRPALRAIISASSLTQSVKGLFSAGVWKSALYLAEKLRKAWAK